jgi:hypothetical protein
VELFGSDNAPTLLTHPQRKPGPREPRSRLIFVRVLRRLRLRRDELETH